MGCGMSRAISYAFTMDFEKAFYYHPLFPVVIIGVILFIIWHFVPEKLQKVLLGMGIAIFIIVYMYRMIFMDIDFMECNLSKGYVGKIVKNTCDLVKKMFA